MNDWILLTLNILSYISVPVLMWLDSQELKKARCVQPSWWWVLCYPGWLFRRLKYNPDRKLRSYLITACTCYAIIFILSVLSGMRTALYEQNEEIHQTQLNIKEETTAVSNRGNNTLTREQAEQVLAGGYNSATPDMTDNARVHDETVPVASALSIDSLRQAFYQRCGKPVFYAQTADHKKEVQICIVTPSVSYSFGKIGDSDKEIDITIPAGNASYAYQSNRAISIYEFTVSRGDIRYEVTTGTNDSGELSASLDVYKDAPEIGKHLTTIKLAPETVVNNIDYGLQDEGIKVSDDF